ncbi:hypothetical protein DSM104329_01585 [Capillimicrobium parvum]|uniref:HDOD domain-containing protein n=2 Tax=Capillimicrobium parvum TaxID=2884022 RepID=A0A9E6XVY3_9ACTN|nr:hypothetical protein DSM104329_01585 [Capillimicrobium parvum]
MDGVRWRDAVDPEIEDRLAAAVDELALLPVLDATVARIVAAVEDPDAASADLVAVLEGDPAFARRLIDRLDDPGRPPPLRVRTIRQAVLGTGRPALHRLALEVAVHRFLAETPAAGAARARLRHNASVAAAAAVTIAARTGTPPAVPHLAALLHDAGELVLALAFTPSTCAALALEHPNPTDRARAQRTRLGVDHAVAGAMLAERWNLDEGVPEAIALHHGGATGTASPTTEIAVVQLAVQVPHLASGGEPDHAVLWAALERCRAPAALLDELLADPAVAAPPRPADRARPGVAASGRPGAQPSTSSSPRSATSAASRVL